ncbi:MAG: SusD/RagB family nutrient-binding outer membrane lipoprotein [Bacteroidales bacterium]|nr:SusD/RagB family nutrient-binding outer membrane lipoprotein [Bacteroidales bacterium]
MKKLLIITIAFSLTMVSCTKKFEEMNSNPTTPTGTQIPHLFNGLIASLQLGWNEQFYLSNEIFYPESELGALIASSWDNYTIGTEEIWGNYYSSLSNIYDIEVRLDEYLSDKNDDEIGDRARAQLVVIKAYKTFKMTDIFGDIPYFEAGKIWLEASNNSYRQPQFDSQEDIYKSILEELVWARDILNSGKTVTDNNHEFYTFENDALLYNNYARWGKFANALILRHGLRMYDKDPNYAKPILEEAFNKPELAAYEDICMWPRQQNWINEGANWSFREHNNLRMGVTAWQSVADTNFSNVFVDGIFDYRAYIFYDTKNKDDNHPKGTWVPYPQIKDENTPAEGGSPYAQSRKNNFWFKPSCNFSPFNYYLVSDNEDYIPEILFTTADVNFIKAEIIAKGIVSGSLMEIDQMLTNGIKNSCYFWNQMPDNCTKWTENQEAYAAIIGDNVDTKAQFMASNIMNHYLQINGWNIPQEKYIDYIVEQRWLNYFRQPWEAWALARRTFRTPTTTNHAKLTSYRMTIPPSEVTYNSANYQSHYSSDLKSTPVWWMTQR